MTFQGIHFDEVLMTLSQCEAKEEEEERKAEAKEECQCEAEEREGEAEAEARLLEGSQYVQKAEGSKHDVLRVDLSWV